MGYKARLFNVIHLVSTVCVAVIMAVAFSSNNWLDTTLLEGGGTTYSSGVFQGCIGLLNTSVFCSTKIVYGLKATFNLKGELEPVDFARLLIETSQDLTQVQDLNKSFFQVTEMYQDEGKLTFATEFRFANAGDPMNIIICRVSLFVGLMLVVVSAIFGFFFSCVYSTKSTRVIIFFYLLGIVMIVWGSTILYLPLVVDVLNPPPNVKINISLGLILTISSVVGFLLLGSLLSVTLLTVEKGKIKDMIKTATLINRATLMTINARQNTMMEQPMGNHNTIMGML